MPCLRPVSDSANSRLEWLFKQCADVWGRNVILKTIGTVYRSLPSMGPCSGTQDMPELRAHFGSGNTSTNRQTPYPMLRLVTLMNVRSHVICHAAISPYRKSLASEFIHSLPDKSVTLLDSLLRCRPVAAYSGRRQRPSLAHPGTWGWYTRNLSAMAAVTVCCK